MGNVKTTGDKIFDIINYAFFAVLGLVMAYPIWHQVCLSFSNAQLAKTGGFFFWPRQFTTEGYEVVLTSSYIWVAFRNSVFITVMSVLLGVLITCGIAYLLSKSHVPGVKTLSTFVLITFLFSGGMIPTYLVVVNTGLRDNLWALIIPTLFAPYNIIITKSFIRGIPGALEESALIDGANYATIFFKIILPLSKPVMATLAIWVAVSAWNDYLPGLLYTRSKSNYILPLLVRDIVLGASDMSTLEVAAITNAEIINAATIVIATVPILIVYPFLQKHFTKGIMLGAVKG